MPIHTAAGLGQVECLKVLLDHINDPGQRKPRGETMVNVSDNYPRTAFWIAAYNRNIECMKVLLNAGADPSIGLTDRYGPFPSVPFTTLGAVIHHKHLCRECKLEGLYRSGELEQAQRDYAENQPPPDCKKCVECKTADCECDAVEECMELFSFDNMIKFMKSIPLLRIDQVQRLLNSGLMESIHLLRPDLLQLVLQFGANLYDKVESEFDYDSDPRMRDLNDCSLISVLTATDRLVSNKVLYKNLPVMQSLVISVVSFLQWIAVYKPSSTSSMKKGAFDCLQVILDYHKSPYDHRSAMRQEKNFYGIGELVLTQLAGSSWFEGFKIVLESGLVNINHGIKKKMMNPRASLTAINTAIHFHYMPFQKLQLLFFHGASTKGTHFSSFSYMLPVDETVKVASLLLAAGFPRSNVHSAMKKWRKDTKWSRVDEKGKDMINGFIKDLRHKKLDSLQNCCHDALRHHLLAVHPYTNLFHLVPQLPLPHGIKEFLLYNMELTPVLTPEQYSTEYHFKYMDDSSESDSNSDSGLDYESDSGSNTETDSDTDIEN